MLCVKVGGLVKFGRVFSLGDFDCIICWLYVESFFSIKVIFVISLFGWWYLLWYNFSNWFVLENYLLFGVLEDYRM